MTCPRANNFFHPVLLHDNMQKMLDVNTRKRHSKMFKLRHIEVALFFIRGHSIHSNAKLPFKKKVSQEERGKNIIVQLPKSSLIIVNLYTDNMLHCTKCETFTKTLTTTLLSLGWDRIIYMSLSCLSFVFGGIYSSGLSITFRHGLQIVVFISADLIELGSFIRIT